ncbi:thioredoxin family protein [Alkaliphilus serpentinus]|uniref:Thioredoxin family protein n=1 Tax=Alkaliphilus serpentinus TaxID=1482731 RepID=A0A833M7F9_9FIRM|nr:thioredoxin family protein [Alkaliphilus serpentinus]KAB3530338.1 thioredoxin family protein [Alkaliphilus serpentinus]
MDFQKLYESGCSFLEFINKDEDINREKIIEVYEAIEIDENLLHKIKEVNRPIYILVFAEIWCPDCIINVPALQKINEINSNVHFSILPREGNEKVLAPYRVGGKVKIPTFIVLDRDYKELGAFIEIPTTVREIANRGNEVEIIVAKRKYRKGEFISNTIEEILSIIEKLK